MQQAKRKTNNEEESKRSISLREVEHPLAIGASSTKLR